MKIEQIGRRDDSGNGPSEGRSGVYSPSSGTDTESGTDEPANSSETTAGETNHTGLIQNHLHSIRKPGYNILDHPRFLEKLSHVDKKDVPDWLIHARGSGAHGYFQPSRSWSDLTEAEFLQDPEIRTPVFVRFSTVAGSSSSADRVRNVHGFETRFHTRNGYFDLVANNMPVYLIQAGIRYPDLVHSIKPDPGRTVSGGVDEHNNFWEFVSRMPESLHMILWLLSDRGIPRSFRMMEGYGVHFSRFINREGRERYVKFHWKPLLGSHSLAWDEAQKLRGKEPDWLRRDLWKAIDRGDYPEYELGVQIVDREDVARHDLNLRDATRIIPEDIIPVTPLGKMVLNRNAHYGREINRIDFHPENVTSGIGILEPGMGRRITGDRESRFQDHYSQARMFWNSVSEAEQRHIVQAACYELARVKREIRRRMVDHFYQIAPGLGEKVAGKLDMSEDVEDRSPGSTGSREGRSSVVPVKPAVTDTIRSRRIAILVEQGVDAEEVRKMRETLTEKGARVELISKLKGVVTGRGGEELEADTNFVSSGSIRYDAIHIPGGREHARALEMQGEARYFVNEAFSHCKTIGATGEGVEFLEACRGGVLPVELLRNEPVSRDGVICLLNREAMEAFTEQFVQAVAEHRHWDREQEKTYSGPAKS